MLAHAVDGTADLALLSSRSTIHGAGGTCLSGTTATPGSSSVERVR
jgi:hypothetical protein